MNNEYDKETAVKEMTALSLGQSADILDKCVTCFACLENCPQNANPFDLILEMQEKYNSLESMTQLIQFYEKIHKKPGKIKKGLPGKPAISLCINNERPWSRSLGGSLFDDLTQIEDGEYTCHTGWLHMGQYHRLKSELQSYVESLAATGFPEIIFAHAGCWTSIAKAEEYDIRLPFRPVHIFEYLRDQMKARQDEITPLQKKIAHIRPCSSRYTPEMEPVLDELFELIGIERTTRKYDRQKSLCCGALLGDRKEMARAADHETRTLNDAEQSGAEGLTAVCLGCFEAVGKGALDRGMDLYMVTDLCRLALGEELPELPLPRKKTTA